MSRLVESFALFDVVFAAGDAGISGSAGERGAGGAVGAGGADTRRSRAVVEPSLRRIDTAAATRNGH